MIVTALMAICCILGLAGAMCFAIDITFDIDILHGIGTKLVGTAVIGACLIVATLIVIMMFDVCGVIH